MAALDAPCSVLNTPINAFDRLGERIQDLTRRVVSAADELRQIGDSYAGCLPPPCATDPLADPNAPLISKLSCLEDQFAILIDELNRLK